MDAGTEKKLIESLKKVNVPQTLILITHRTALLTLVDRVIVLDKGAIVASGSVDGFMKASGISDRATKLETAQSVNPRPAFKTVA